MQTVAVTSVQLDCFSNTKLTGSDLTWGHLLERRNEHGCTWWQGKTHKRMHTRTDTHTDFSVSPHAHPDAQKNVNRWTRQIHVALTTWWDAEVECGSLVNIVASEDQISVWINLTLSKIQRLHAFTECVEWWRWSVRRCWCDNTKGHAVVTATAYTNGKIIN